MSTLEYFDSYVGDPTSLDLGGLGCHVLALVPALASLRPIKKWAAGGALAAAAFYLLLSGAAVATTREIASSLVTGCPA